MDDDTIPSGGTPPVLPQPPGSLRLMRRWSHFLDKAFRVPGTKLRFGWDPILGLVPGLGDVSTGLFSLFLLITAFRTRVPGVIRARMVLNSLLDLIFGAVPLAGDLFDFAYKSNSRNLALLERHANPGARPRPSDWIFVIAVVAVAAAVVIVPLLFLGAVLETFETEFLRMRLFSGSRQ